MAVEVIDASALAAVLFGEPDGEAVASRATGRDLVAPSLIRYELASVFLKKARRYPEQGPGFLEALRLYPRLEVDEVQVPIVELGLLAERVEVTAYDAAYLWLADHLAAPLITLDDRVGAAARRLELPESPD